MKSDGKVQRLPGLARDTRHRNGLRQLVNAPQEDAIVTAEKSSATATAITSTVAAVPEVEEADETNCEDMQGGGFSVYLYYLGSTSVSLVILFIITTAIAALSERVPGTL
jgi:hypothetical protein